MSKKKGLVPHLRFPEFGGADAWSNKKLREIADVNASGDLDPENFSASKTNNHIYPIYSNSVSKKGLYGYCTYSRYSKDSVTITARGTLGVAFYRDHDYVGIGRLLVLSKLKGVIPYFLQEIWNHSAKIPLENGGIPQLTAIQARSVELYIPEEKEQIKIVNCLTSVEELITSQIQKLDILNTHKKGLTQRLFPLQGETMPKRRFPEFQDNGEWSTEVLGGKTIKVGSGITPNGGDKNYKPEGRPFVRSQNVGWGCLILDDVVFIDEETHSSFPSTEIKEDDVLLNITGASIGRSAIASLEVEGGNVNQHVCIIRTKKEELSPLFLNRFLISQAGQNQIDSFQAGGNRQGLNFAQIRSFLVPIPPSIEEQQKIAACFALIDEQIANQIRKIESLKMHKKGLMQKLFPNPELSNV